jgi:hypothetical protein
MKFYYTVASLSFAQIISLHIDNAKFLTNNLLCLCRAYQVSDSSRLKIVQVVQAFLRISKIFQTIEQSFVIILEGWMPRCRAHKI